MVGPRVEDDALEVEGRVVVAEDLAGLDAEDFERLGHQADLAGRHDVARMGVELQVVGRAGLRVGPGGPQAADGAVGGDVEVDVEVIAR